MNLNLVLSPEHVSRIHDVLICLAKFDENIGLEASKDKVTEISIHLLITSDLNQLTLSALNSSKTSSASFIFSSDTFFQTYRFVSDSRLPNGVEAHFTCRILAKVRESMLASK